MIERLKAGLEDPYDPIEASIHVGRYAMALPFASGRRVLDIACGEGYGSWLLADAGAGEVVGVDISAEAIAKARANFPHERLRFEEGAGEALSELLPQGHFDLIVCIETIEHVADVEAFLRDLRAVAAPGAIFVITCPNDHWYYRDGGTNPYHVRRLTLDEFKQYSDLFEDDVYTAIDLTTCCEGRTSYGGPSEASVKNQIELAAAQLNAWEANNA